MVIMGWTGCQENAVEIWVLHSKTNRIIHKQKQQSMIGVKLYCWKCWVHFTDVSDIMHSRVKATVESALSATRCSLTPFCKKWDSGKSAENAFVSDFRLLSRCEWGLRPSGMWTLCDILELASGSDSWCLRMFLRVITFRLIYFL
jgi:hypothetical protein